MISQDRIKSAGFMLQWQSDIFGVEFKTESYVQTEEETAQKVIDLCLWDAFDKGYLKWVEIFTVDLGGENGEARN